MQMTLRKRPAARLVVVLGLALSLLVPTGTAAAADECATDIGTDLPVVLVHGFNSSMSTWDGDVTSVDQTLAREAGIHVQWFEYSDVATQWVTHDRIGPRLAAFLLCTAQVSREAGGPGKVVVVAHSMGGLAIRCALTVSCGKIDGVDQIVDLVITLGTPHTGSFLRPGPLNVAGIGINAGTQALLSACRSPLAGQPQMRDLCRSLALASGAIGNTDLGESVGALVDSPAARAFTLGSPELDELPDFPGHVAVHAMAGEIRLVTHVLWGLSTEEWSVGDGVVGLDSATARNQDGDAAGGGTTVHPCGYLDWYLNVVVRPYCDHVTFTQDSTFTQDVLTAVRTYRDGLPRAQYGSFVLGLGGAIGDLGLFAGEDQALALVTSALGPPDSDSGWGPPVCGPDGRGPIWRYVQWGAFELVLIDSPLPTADASGLPGEPLSHVSGWTLFERDPGPLFPDLAMESGLTLGSTREDVLAAFSDIADGFDGALLVFEGDYSNLYVEFDDQDRVAALTSGTDGCGDV